MHHSSPGAMVSDNNLSPNLIFWLPVERELIELESLYTSKPLSCLSHPTLTNKVSVFMAPLFWQMRHLPFLHCGHKSVPLQIKQFGLCPVPLHEGHWPLPSHDGQVTKLLPAQMPHFSKSGFPIAEPLPKQRGHIKRSLLSPLVYPSPLQWGQETFSIPAEMLPVPPQFVHFFTPVWLQVVQMPLPLQFLHTP